MSEIDPEAKELLTEVNEAQKINDFDYNKMMTDFEMSARHENHLRKIRKKWEDEGKRYNETIEKMKELREENYKKKNAALLKKLKKKEQLLMTLLESSNKKKMALRNKNMAILLEREKQARDNVEKYQEEIEEKRKVFQNQNEEKFQHIIDRYNDYQNELHDKNVKKIIQSEIRHNTNLDKLYEENEKILKDNQDKAFKKYCAIYWHRKEQARLHKQKKKDRGNKLQEKKEKLEELEREADKKRKLLMKKLAGIEKKRKENEKERNEKIEKDKRRRKEYFDKCMKNKEEIEAENDEYRQIVLADQNEIIKRGINKESISDLKRINAGEKIVINQLTLENNLPAFRKKMDMIKSASVLKKSPEERLTMYKEKKREEAERKKKELEDKMQK